MDASSLGRVLELLILPPGGPIAIGLVGMVLSIWHRPAGVALMGSALVLIYLLSLPVTSAHLMQALQWHQVLGPEGARSSGAGAIVVLGAGRHTHAPEFGEPTVSGLALERLRFTARVHHWTGLPVLASGGGAPGEYPPESAMAERVLEDELGVTPIWTEETSRNTRENATNSATMLRDRGILRVILVTHAVHMGRAAESFRNAGIEVIPAPTAFYEERVEWTSPRSWIPSRTHASRISMGVHEILGMLWYRLTKGP